MAPVAAYSGEARILRGYLGAWFPKLAWKGRVLFIDGFAGPGEYAGGEPGSPIIALNAALEHKHDLSSCELIFVFIEEDADRYRNLVGLIDAISMPAYVKVQRANGAFAEVVSNALDSVEAGGRNLAPAFVMVDPFGFKGMPMELLSRIARHPKSELLVSFMYESINRWLSQPQLATGFDDLFGREDWRRALDRDSPRERLDFLHDLYVEQLRAAGMTYVRSFLMLDKGNRPEYFLIFATKHIEGLKAMKRAMWRVAPSGSFQFSDATNRDQLTLFAPEPDFNQLKNLLLQRFGTGVPIRIEDIEFFVVAGTAFLETHFKRSILNPMEKEGRVQVLASPRKKAGTYPNGTILTFRT